MKKHGYKVVGQVEFDDGYQYFSCITSIYNYSVVVYEIDEKAFPSPNCGPLCVFTDEGNATTFIEKNRYIYGLALFKCEYEPSNETKVWTHNDVLTELPIGTDLANWVILREKIKTFDVI